MPSGFLDEEEHMKHAAGSPEDAHVKLWLPGAHQRR